MLMLPLPSCLAALNIGRFPSLSKTRAFSGFLHPLGVARAKATRALDAADRGPSPRQVECPLVVRENVSLFQFFAVDSAKKCPSLAFPFCLKGTMASHQPRISGKCGLIGLSHMRGKSGSVGSDLQFLGVNNPWQDKVCASRNFIRKPQRAFCSPPEYGQHPAGSHAGQGAFILPSYPFSSPRHSPKHSSPPADPLKKPQNHPVNFSNSWPLKSFEGLPKPAHQKTFSCPVAGEDAVKNPEAKSQDTPPIQLKPAFVRSPASRRGLSGTKPVPPIPRGVSPLPEKAEVHLVEHRNAEPEDLWLNGKDKKLPFDLLELSISEKELEEEEMQRSLRSLRNSAAKKRAKLNGSSSDLESPDSVLKLDLTSESPSCLSSPTTSSYSESGVYSQDSALSPLSTAHQGVRTMCVSFSAQGGREGRRGLVSPILSLAAGGLQP
ncbi:TOG array regulator of axonemal microtubules protein 1 [Varanus komodoensis]|nr:TOG array regulator of axonemal microtubules protein 1 [Varanus komodoensis]